MRILSLDAALVRDDGESSFSTFESDVNLFDFDLVIWDPKTSADPYPSHRSHEGQPLLSESESPRFIADVRRRHEEFKSFIESGRILVVIARPPQPRYVFTDNGRIRGFQLLDIMSAIPLCDAVFKKASGNRISITGHGPVQDHLRDHVKHLSYATTIESAPGMVIATVAGTEMVVASLLRLESGGVLALLPPATFGDFWNDPDSDSPVDTESAYQNGLVAALTSLGGVGEIERPAWAARFATQKQLTVRAAVVEHEIAVENAKEELTILQADYEALTLRDQLFLGTGRALELQVKEVLELLGGDVSEPAANRDDWRVTFNGRPAVVEIKGVTKSAAEKHAAQLEKWVAGAYEETGIEHKGILIVNTWRNVPLDERAADDFPAQMIPYSTGRGHVLMTGLELFIIATDIESDPTRAAYWRDRILETSGRLDGVPGWREIIHEGT